ncbi:MAG: hypothetical protein ACOY5Y_07530 [Pseudomonadota bacterium]
MIAVGVIDVGSPRSGKLGWAIVAPNQTIVTGGDLDAFIERMGEVGRAWPMAIGFEAPLFIPTRQRALDVLSGRKGEGSRPWSAGAGAAVTTASLAVTTYALAGLRRLLPDARASTDWTAPVAQVGDCLFFEAFVTGASKDAAQTRTETAHTYDALIAAEAAQELLTGSAAYRSAIEETEVFSLLGAALLRTGWTSDLGVLSAPCLVVRPGFDHFGAGV